MTSSPHSDNQHRHHHHHHHHGESEGDNDENLISEINAQVALFREMMIQIGTPKDCPEMREKIRKSRRNIVDACKHTWQLLLPQIRSSLTDGIPMEQPHLVFLFFICQVFLGELYKCSRLVQLIPMDMSGYFENRAGPSNIGNVISQILLCKQIAPDFNQEEIFSINKDSQDLHRILHEIQEYLPQQDANPDITYVGKKRVEKNEPIELRCEANAFVHLKWVKDGISLSAPDYNVTSAFNSDTNRRTASLFVPNASLRDSGNYKCSDDAEDFGFNVSVAFDAYTLLIKRDEDGEDKKSDDGGGGSENKKYDYILAEFDKELKLECEVRKGDKKVEDVPDNLEIQWHKTLPSDSLGELQKLESTKHVKINEEELLIKHFLVEDAGMYGCRLVNKTNKDNGDGKGGGRSEDAKSLPPLTPIALTSMAVKFLPHVYVLKDDQTVVEGEKAELHCHVMGNITTVKWRKDNGTYYEGSGDRVILSRLNSIQNANLTIKSANHTLDKGMYYCTGETIFDKHEKVEASVNLRVRSKYAALYPFIGICVEVFLLCLIIVIYEKKRDKTEMEESDTDQGPETKSTPDHGNDSIRHRK